MAMMLCLLALVLAIPWSGAVLDNPALTFNCSSENNVVVINAGMEQSLQDICDKNLLIAYDPTKNTGNVLGSTSELKISFSGNDFHNSQADQSSRVELLTSTIGSGDKKWSPTGIDNKMLFPKKLCGTGFILAEIVDNGVVIAGAEGRAVVVCNNSDVDVKLEVVSNTQITIPAVHSFPDFIEYFKQNGTFGKLQLTMLTGSLPSVTNETLHWILMYLRRPYSPSFYKSCDVPDYKLGDVIVGTGNFSEGIDAGGHLDLDSLLNGKPTKITTDMCGHMELVVMFDPLKTDSDSDECNNFKRFDVNVDCKDLPPAMPIDTMCHVVSNPISSNEVWAKYGDRVYSYEDLDHSWHEILPGNPDAQNILFGMSRVAFVEDYLKNLYKHPDTGLCRFVKERTPVTSADDDSVVPIVGSSTLDNKIDEVIKQMKSVTTVDMSDIEKAINEITTSTVVSPDFVYSLDVVVHTLHMLKDFTRGNIWYKSVGLIPPKNYTRMTFAALFYGIASTVRLMPTNTLHIKHALCMVNITLKYLNGTTYFDKNVLMKIKMARKGLQEMMESTMVHYACPFGMKLPLPVKVLYELGNGFDGEYDESFDQISLTYCHQQLMATYMRSGGSRVQSKDIAKMMEVHTMYPLPSKCIQHPFDDFGNPIRVSKKKRDGVVVLGGLNPLSKTFAWKPIARCRCDDCMTGYSSHTTPMWTASAMDYLNTTQSP